MARLKCGIIAFVLTILSSQVLLTSSAESDKKTGVEEVEELLSLGDDIDFHGASRYTILMGSSGVGKSTLAKFITQDPSLTVIKKGTRTFLFADNDATISTVTRKSKTLLPNYYKDNETGQVIVDLPGFSDTREPQYEIAAAYFIKRVLESAESLKLVFVENKFSLTEGQDRYGFSRLVRHIAQLIPDMGPFEGAVGLIATKAQHNGLTDEENNEEILEFIRSFADEFEEKDDEEMDPFLKSQQKVLRIMIGPGDGSNMALFNMPIKEGSPWESYFGNKCLARLRQLVFENIPFKLIPRNTRFNYSLSAEGQVFVKENLLNTTKDRVLREAENIFEHFKSDLEVKLLAANTTAEKAAVATKNNQTLHLFASKLHYLQDFVSELMTLRVVKNYNYQNVTLLVRKAEFFHGVVEKSTQKIVHEIKHLLKSYLKTVLDTANFYSFLVDLEVELDTYWPQYNRIDLGQPLTQSNFRKIILNAEKYNLQIKDKDALYAVEPRKEMIDDLNQILKQHLSYKINFKTKSSQVNIEGQTILVSEINRKIDISSKTNLKKIYIYAQKNIFIDENLLVQNADLYLVSPVIEAVIKEPGLKPIIKTIGADSKRPMQQAAPCAAPGLLAQDGQTGKVGGKAGNILIAALEIKAPANLMIESKGGRGGPGQRGGNGCDGQTSPTPDYSPASRFGEFHEVIEHYSRRGYTVSVTNVRALQLSNSKQNINPTNGGNGGEGGPGGSPGSVLIQSKKSIDGLIGQHLSFGEAGEGGAGGVGGRGMPRCSEAHLYCERFESRQKDRNFNVRRFTCQWFRNDCDIIISHKCRFVTAKLCPELTPNAFDGKKGGQSSLAANKPLPPKQALNTNPVKLEVAKLAKRVKSHKMKELNAFIQSVL